MEDNQRANTREETNKVVEHQKNGSVSQHAPDGKLGDSAPAEADDNMAEVLDLAERVTNVSIHETEDMDSSDNEAQVSEKFSTPLPQRERHGRNFRAKSTTSFVSCSGTPSQTDASMKKSERNIESYFIPVGSTPKKSTDPLESTRNVGSDGPVSRPPTPNIVDGILADEGATAPNPDVTLSEHDADNRGAKRKRNASRATNNYEVVAHRDVSSGKNDLQLPAEPQPLDDMSRQLFAESGRPSITITSQVSDNRSKGNNQMSVSFQVPTGAPGEAQAGPSHQYDPPKGPKKEVDPGMPWMKKLELDYFTTARASVVAEARANLRSRMLNEISADGKITPWALRLAPLPVYMHPHADKVAELMKQQAIEFQQKCAVILQESATFQSEKVAVDKVSLKNIFEGNGEGYKTAVGALFDARLRVQTDVREQMFKYKTALGDPANQVSDKDLTSIVNGKVPAKYSYVGVMSTPQDELPPPPQGESQSDTDSESRSRGRKRSKSRERGGRSNSRARKMRGRGRPQFRGQNRGGYGGYNNNYRYQNYERDDRYYNGGYDRGYDRDRQQEDRPRANQNNWYYPEPPARPQDRKELSNPVDPRYFTPEVIQKIAQAYGDLQK